MLLKGDELILMKRRLKDNLYKYNGFQIPNCLVNRKIEYLITRTDEVTNRQVSYTTDNIIDFAIIKEYWRQSYKLLSDNFNRNYYNNNLVKITEFPLKSGKDNISDKVIVPIDILVDLYAQGYLIGESSINLENGFISDINIYISYNPDDWLDRTIFSYRRTHKSFSYEENCTIKCEIITPLKYCKSIIKKNFEERLRKWSKKARIICLSMKENIEE